MNIIKKTIELPDGRVIEIETGKLAKQADGSAVVRMGGTMLLATVTCAKEVTEGTDFLPLQVDYKEKFYAAGRFPGGFMKREGKASDYEILIARLVDRALRPLFPDDFHLAVFVNIWLISAEKDIQPDALAGLAASAALAASDLPFLGPISEVRVSRIDGKFVINPNFSEMEKADLELMVAATEENIMMVEGEMNEVTEDVMLEAIKFAHEEIKKHCRVQKELNADCGKTVNVTIRTTRRTRTCARPSTSSAMTSATPWPSPPCPSRSVPPPLSRSRPTSWLPCPKRTRRPKPPWWPATMPTKKKRLCAT